MNDYEILFAKLGYNINIVGFQFFLDLVIDVQGLLKEGKSDEEIKEVLPNYALDYYHFFYEISGKRYYAEIDAFCNSRIVTKKNAAINRKIFKTTSKLNVSDSIIMVAKYFNTLEKEKDENNKSM